MYQSADLSRARGAQTMGHEAAVVIGQAVASLTTVMVLVTEVLALTAP